MSDDFNATINHLFAKRVCEKIVVMGIGNELRHDDAVGLAVVDKLGPVIDDPSVVVLNCQQAPENFTGYVKRVQPTCVVLIDAADFGAVPGDASVFRLGDLENSSLTTHTGSLTVLGEYLHAEIRCDVFIIGIQPADCEFGTGLSPPARTASIAVADSIRTAINRFRTKEE